jgi:hypothetical protein
MIYADVRTAIEKSIEAADISGYGNENLFPRTPLLKINPFFEIIYNNIINSQFLHTYYLIVIICYTIQSPNFLFYFNIPGDCPMNSDIVPVLSMWVWAPLLANHRSGSPCQWTSAADGGENHGSRNHHEATQRKPVEREEEALAKRAQNK